MQILLKVFNLIFKELDLLMLLTDLDVALVLGLLVLLLFLIQFLAKLVVDCLQIL